MTASKTLTITDSDGDRFTLTPLQSEPNVLQLEADSGYAVFLTREDVDALIDFLREFETRRAPVHRIIAGSQTVPSFPPDFR